MYEEYSDFTRWNVSVQKQYRGRTNAMPTDVDAKEQSTESRSPVAVVLDVGSLLTKAGFSPDDCPRVVFPTFDPVKRKQEEKNDDTTVLPAHPIERGYITTQWGSIEDVWHHTFYNELRVQPDSQPVLLAIPPMNPKASTERMVQILFDTFNIPSLYVNVAAVLALYSSGRTTGCVVDSGHGVTHIVPVYEGYHLPNAVVRVDIAGCDVVAHLEQMLLDQWKSLSLSLGDSTDHDLSRLSMDIKETLAYVAKDFSSEMEKPDPELEQFFPIPGSDLRLAIHKEAFRCTEILFQPKDVSLASGTKSQVGIVQATYNSMICASRGAEIFNVLCANIVLTGGNTLLSGFEERFSQDMKQMVSKRNFVGVVAPATRKFDAWIGGSIIASLPSMDTMWLKQEKYREVGPSSIYQHFNT